MPSLGQPVFTNFIGGELSPKVKGRFDLAIFQHGLETCENWTILPYGGMERRDGSLFVQEADDNDKKSRLKDIIFSRTEAYVFELADLKINVFRFDSVGDPEEVVAASMVSPFLEAELDDVDFIQDQDIIYAVHPNHAPQRIRRVSPTSWTIVSLDAADELLNPESEITPLITSQKQHALKAPYLNFPGDLFPGVTNKFSINVTIDLTAVGAFSPGTEVTVTATGGQTWSASDVGALFMESSTTILGTKGYYRISSFVSASVVKAKMLTDANGYSSSLLTRIVRWGAWDDGRTSFPNAVSKFENRLIFGNVTKREQFLWGSRTAEFENFEDGTAGGGFALTDASSYTFQLNSAEVNPIRWFESARIFLIATEGAEYRMTGFNAPVTPTSVDIRRQTSHGSKDNQTFRIGQSIFFIQRDGKKLRRLDFSDEFDNYVANDITFISEHITGASVKHPSFQQEPNHTIVMVRADGELVLSTFYPELNVSAWYRYKLNGGTVESTAVIPSFDGSTDKIWISVKRTIDGVTKRYIEVLDDTINTDSAKKFTAVGSDTLTGLGHLEDELVEVVADGVFIGTFTVASSQITVGRTVTDAEVGIGYTATAKLMPFPSKPESKKRHAILQVRLLNSRAGLEIEDEGLLFLKGEDPMDAAPPLFSGLTEAINFGWTEDAQITIKSVRPYDATVLAIAGRLSVGD